MFSNRARHRRTHLVRCLVPDCDGAFLSFGWKDATWHKPTTTETVRRAIQSVPVPAGTVNQSNPALGDTSRFSPEEAESNAIKSFKA